MIEKRIRLSELGDSAARIAHDLGLSVQAEVPLVKRAYVGKSVEVEDDLIHAIVSSERKDLDDEVVKIDNLRTDVFELNPVILYQHDQKIPPIGRSRKTWKENGELHMRIEWAPSDFAQEISKLYRTGFMRSWSIGFLSLDFDQKTKTHRSSLLLETSAVAIGAQIDARVINSIKSTRLRKDIENGSSNHVDEKQEIIAEVRRILAPKISEAVGSELERQGLFLKTAIRQAQLEILRKLGRVVPEDQEEEIVSKYWPGIAEVKAPLIDPDITVRITKSLLDSIKLKR